MKYLSLAILYNGDYFKIRKHVELGKQVPEFSYDGKYVEYGDERYPAALYQCEYPPYVLFYEGNLDLLNNPAVAVIGNRKPSEYSLNATASLVKSLRSNCVIISGLAYGIDIEAHKNALDFRCVAVLGCGVDVCYPKGHQNVFEELKANHLVLSEYPKGVHPQRHHFPFRNRIIAALSKQIYVMSATMKSGTLGTVDEALKLNREIICLPHQINDPTGKGCNYLIEQGASMLTNLKDLSNI